jgi:hypothetical protein
MNKAELRDIFISTIAPVLDKPMKQQDIEDAYQDLIREKFICGSISLYQLYRWMGAGSNLTPAYLYKRMHETPVHRKNREDHRTKYRAKHCSR